MFGDRPSISLPELLAEVDRLERELKELGREAQRGEDFVRQLVEIVERDTRRVGEVERDTSYIAREMLEWEERFLADALNSSAQSSQLLVHMETQARSKLEEERKVTDRLKEELEAKVLRFADKVEKEEGEYRKIPDYVKILQLEKSIQKKAELVEQLDIAVGQMVGEQQNLNKEAKEDKMAWGSFKIVCVILAEKGLELKKQEENLDLLGMKKTELMRQIDGLVTEMNMQKEAARSKPSLQDKSLCLLPDGNSSTAHSSPTSLLPPSFQHV